MARFVKLFLKEDKDRMIEDVVKNLFLKFDVDRSGFLEKRETLKLLDEILGQKGMPPTSLPQFNRFYAEFDLNGDGLISMVEMSKFVRKFTDNSPKVSFKLNPNLSFFSLEQPSSFATDLGSEPNSIHFIWNKKQFIHRTNSNEKEDSYQSKQK